MDSRWGLHADRLALGKGQTYARSVPGLSLLQAADRTLTSCHLTSDLLVSDVSVSQGKHYWACSVEPGSYLVKVRSDFLIFSLIICCYQSCCCLFSRFQVGVGQESKLQEWFHLPEDVASPRCFSFFY